MIFEIDQDKLCEHCKDINENMDRSRCEGSYCDETIDSFCDDNGLVEVTEENKTFSRLTIGDIFYKIDASKIPTIENINVKSVHERSTSEVSINGDYYLEKDSKNNKGFFINKKDCEKRLEEICIRRIIELSKVIGSL